MRLGLLFSFCFFRSLGGAAVPDHAPEPLSGRTLSSAAHTPPKLASFVKVRMASNQTSVSITGMDIRIDGSHDFARLAGARRARRPSPFHRAPSPFQMIKVSASWTAGRTMWTVVDKTTADILHRFVGDEIKLSGDMLRLALKPVPGTLLLRSAHSPAHTGFDVIAMISTDVYLRGVLPREMPAAWPLEAIKAQAVASRSFMLERIRSRELAGRAFHLENTTLDQVFGWDERDDTNSANSATIARALRETDGWVLGDTRGSILPAYFHADCGGRTEVASAVWQENPIGDRSSGDSSTVRTGVEGASPGSVADNVGAVIDRGCPMSPSARWTWTAFSEDLFARLRVPLGLPTGGRILDIRAERHSPTGRVQRLAISIEGGPTRYLSGHELRAIVGFERIKSTSFQVQRTPVGFRLAGRGHGHGVGLCQWGARRLATEGADFRQILSHYYPNSQLMQLSE